MAAYYDRQGWPIDLMQYVHLMDDRDYREVEQTDIGDVLVSTVWLGLDHGLGDAVLIFETMVFGGDLHLEQHRYPTEEQARAGHAEVVERVEATL